MKSNFLSRGLGLLLLSVLLARGAVIERANKAASTACSLLEQQLPGKVSYPGSSTFADAIDHFEITATQNSTCSLEPSSADEVAAIMKIVGRQDIRAPFAIKSSGHATNQGFSSTPGVQISLKNLNTLSYDNSTQVVTMGPGLSWDQAYAELDKSGVTVVGGRVPGVGVGLVLGGGYSWVTDQYGLGVDNIVQLDMVLPNGTYVEVNETSQPDLFWAMKGGLNNFGVVTTLHLKAHPIGQVWGGIINYSYDVNDQVIAALADFSLNNKNPKAQLAAALINTASGVSWQVIFFNDGPQQTAFNAFLNITAVTSNVGTRSFPDFLATSDVINNNAGGFSNMVPIVKYTVPLLEAIQTQVNKTVTQAVADGKSLTAALVGIEPFAGAFDHATPSSYPHSSSRPVTPCNPWMTFSDANDADYFHTALRTMSDAIQAVAIEQGQSLATDIHYPNYSLDDTPLELLYGDNVQMLKEIKAVIDPQNVMGLTGGFKF